MFFEADLKYLIEKMLSILPENESAYLVGGVVRDMFLQKPLHDIDIAYQGEIKAAAKGFADSIGAKYFVLNDRYQTARVIWQKKSGEKMTIDIVGLRGDSIDEDCFARDFTINAMAIDIRSTGTLIDPTHGLEDLRNKLIRACTDSTFEQDPIRILRAIRQSLQLGFRLEKATLEKLRSAANLLPDMTSERIRDEIFRMMSLDNPVSAIHLLEHLNLSPYIFPELSAFRQYVVPGEDTPKPWAHTLLVMSELRNLFDAIVGDYQIKGNGDLRTGEVVLKLGKYRHHLNAFFDECLSSDRTRKELLFIGSLYHDAGKPKAEQYTNEGRLTYRYHDQHGMRLVIEKAKKLALSNHETRWLGELVEFHMYIHLKAKRVERLSDKELFHFFDSASETSIAICLLTMADTLAYKNEIFPQKRWDNELTICQQIMEEYWSKNSRIISPPKYLNGAEIKEILGIDLGPLIGRILEYLREGTAIGLVNNRKEAIQYILQLKDELKVELN